MLKILKVCWTICCFQCVKRDAGIHFRFRLFLPKKLAIQLESVSSTWSINVYKNTLKFWQNYRASQLNWLWWNCKCITFLLNWNWIHSTLDKIHLILCLLCILYNQNRNESITWFCVVYYFGWLYRWMSSIETVEISYKKNEKDLIWTSLNCNLMLFQDQKKFHGQEWNENWAKNKIAGPRGRVALLFSA